MYNIKNFKGFNWVGFFTLYTKEVKRFLNVFAQTILAPAITTLLFYLIFTISIDRNYLNTANYNFSEFLAPGLICMAIMQNAFANTSSSILISKVQGNIVDILMPPMSEYELTFSYVLGGITRGLLVGLFVAIFIFMFVEIEIYNLGIIIYFAIGSSCLLSLFGIMCGIWAKKFDHMAAVTNFIIIPLTFLSGTFYSISRLPDFWQTVSSINPFFYNIDGFRYAFTGVSDSSLFQGMIFLIIINIILIFFCYLMFRKGYKIKS